MALYTIKSSIRSGFRFLLVLGVGLVAFPVAAQHLKPGFDKGEYRELLSVAAPSSEIPEKAKLIPPSGRFVMAYRSPVMGLENLWELWISKDDPVAVLCTRGTVMKSESWLANFYAAMAPAKGAFKINAADSFRYELSSDSRAAVHIGYLLSLAYLAPDILPLIDSCYRAGIKDFLVMGHSQGGAISYLLTAYLYDLQQKGELPADIRFKTYCSAAPKPGNLYFAYSYETKTQLGWAYNVVNAADWVPQTPISIQMLEDINTVSPVAMIRKGIQQQRFPKKQVMRYLYKQLSKPAHKAVKNYQKYLGKEVGKQVKQYLKDYQPPSFFHSNDYVRTGNTIVLYGDAGYYERFPNDGKDGGINHAMPAYWYLLEQLDDH